MSIAVIGAGNWGRNLVRTLAELGALSHVVEASAERRADLAAKYPGVIFLDSHEPLLDEPAVTAVAIATPVPTHHALARAFLEADRDVFVEKPITLTTHEAEDLTALAERRGRILMAGHLLLYQPAVAKVAALIADGAIGRPFTYHLERLKLGRARSVEDVLWSFGVHDIAVLLHLVGETPAQVVRTGHSGLNAGIDDDAYLHLTFPSGVQAHLHNSWLWPIDRRGLTVIGSDGMIVYDEKAQTLTLHRKRIHPATLESADAGEEIVFQGAPQPLELEMRHFLDCIATRQSPQSDGRSAVEVIRVLERAGKG